MNDTYSILIRQLEERATDLERKVEMLTGIVAGLAEFDETLIDQLVKSRELAARQAGWR